MGARRSDRDWIAAIDRAALDAALATAKRAIGPTSIALWSRPIEAIAVEITPPVAARLGRRVVAAALRDA